MQWVCLLKSIIQTKKKSFLKFGISSGGKIFLAATIWNLHGTKTEENGVVTFGFHIKSLLSIWYHINRKGNTFSKNFQEKILMLGPISVFFLLISLVCILHIINVEYSFTGK